MSARKRKTVVTPWGPVHSIPGPDATVVALAQEILAKAKAGEIKGLMVSYVDGGDGACSDWTAGNASANDMIAAVSQLWFMVMKRKYEDD